eukprot:SM000206S06268  [mRNA]  locus=s206:123095:126021:+ [translate_table: standard]
MSSAGEGVESRLEDENSAESSLVFTTRGCPFCKQAKTLLKDQHVPFTEVNVDSDQSLREAVAQATGRKTVPVVFVNGHYIGGADELKQAVGDKSFAAVLYASPMQLPSNLQQALRQHQSRSSGDTADRSRGEDMSRALWRTLRLEQVAASMAKDAGGVPKHSVRMGVRKEKHVFSGADAVAWFRKELPDVESDADAVQMGRDLQDAQLLHHVTFSQSFQDEASVLFRLHAEEPGLSQALNARRVWVKPTRPASEVDGASIARQAVSPEYILCLFLCLQVAETLRQKVSELYEEALSEDGRTVRYNALKSSQAYGQYVAATEELQRVDLFSLTRMEKMAFFINVYNSLVIHAMVEGGTPSNILQRLFFYKQNMYHIGGVDYSLDDIENGVLRGNSPPSTSLTKSRPFDRSDPRRFQAIQPMDPRVHFALNCGAKSCPPITVYTAENLDDALATATAAFLEGEYELDKTAASVTLSKIFDWYKEDFGSSEEERVRWVLRHLDQSRQAELDAALAESRLAIKFRKYDWDVNE